MYFNKNKLKKLTARAELKIAKFEFFKLYVG